MSATFWREIKTAPKNGTKILFYDPKSKTIFAGWWDKAFELRYDKVLDDTVEIGAWTDGAVSSFAYEETCSYQPTYWMPLPEPPEPVQIPKRRKNHLTSPN